MSRKRKAPKKIPIVDPRYKSLIIPKLINSIMYDGKKTVAEKIIYDAIDKIKSKSKEEPINIVNECITIAAPCSIGLQITGHAVLSIISGIPLLFPISATSLIGKTLREGLGKVSA